MIKRGELTPAQKRTAAGSGAAALTLAALMVFTPTWEGTKLDPYKDVGGVPTVCTGQTHVEMRHYTREECDVMLRKELKARMEFVRSVNPRIVEDPLQWAAHADLAFNVGNATYARSSVATLYREGHEQAACHAIGKYRLVNGKVWRSLVARREGDAARLGEIELCLSTPPSPWSPPS